MEIEWTDEGRALMDSKVHVVCLGGPGSGKTTMALLKAEAEIRLNTLKSGQRILFLSFARATISRVEEHAKKILRSESRHELEINTYHGFTWGLLRSHGYLLTENSPIELLAPPQAASLLSSLNSDDEKAQEKMRLFEDKGLLDFDLFAPKAAELLARSESIRKLVSKTYPIIILDEFQDTNDDEWALIQLLGIDSRLVALADPEQRIYEFRGASPTRIPEFIEKFLPEEIDFSQSNYRSSGTDICTFGNDLLKGTNKGKEYTHVEVTTYPIRKAPANHLSLKIAVYQRRTEILKKGADSWSLGILVPTKRLMLEVSEYLASSQSFQNGKKAPPINNEAALDAAGPSLAACVIAGVLAGGPSPEHIAKDLITDLSNHMRGRKGGGKPSQQQLALADSLDNFLDTGKIRGSRRKATADECMEIAKARKEVVFTGDPGADWITIRKLLESAEAEELKNIAMDARALKFLNRGTQLRSTLAEIWRSTGSYEGAREAVDSALLQEHFSSASKEYRGVHVMTVHKSKGKQFSEVIIYEGSFQGRLLRTNATARERAQALLSLRVAVTRAEQFTTIITPGNNPCPFLV